MTQCQKDLITACIGKAILESSSIKPSPEELAKLYEALKAFLKVKVG
jgi:hypothetical protein